MNAPLKVGLIVDDERLDGHGYQLVRWANSSGVIRISHLIIQQIAPAEPKRSLLARIMRDPRDMARVLFWRLMERKEAAEVAAIDAYRDSRYALKAGAEVPERIHVTPRLSKSGRVYRYAEDDLEKIRRERFDILIRFGSGILRGEILDSARLGILSFHHGDNRVNRGGPPGFWEVYYRWSKTGFVVQRLTEELDGGEVLLRGFVPTQATHLLNRALLYRKSYFHLRTLLARIARSGELPPPEPNVPFSGRLYLTPRAHEIATYLLKRASRTLLGHARNALRRTERWGVCFLKSDWPNAAYWRGSQLETPKGHFLADPFVATRDGRTCVFVENYIYHVRKAHISVFEVGNTGARELGVALAEEWHLSFPFLFEHDGALFMCPESMGARQIRIYRCTDFPLRWTLECIVMQGVSAVDSMLFAHGGRWWLLTNLSEIEPVENNSELHIFSAPDPLSGSWTPHPRNPVLIDPDCARNAGLLRDQRGFVRVCQSQGFGSYGAAARLMRITRLDEEEYAEEQIGQLSPSFHPRAHGTHHLHSNGQYSVWDFKCWERVMRSHEQMSAIGLRSRARYRGGAGRDR